MNDVNDPREALEAIASARQAVPGNMQYSVAYDVFYGAWCGLLVAGQGLPSPWSLVALIVGLTGLVISVRLWKRKFGWWISGYSPKRARWVAIAMVAIFLGLMGVSLWSKYAGISWVPLATGVAGFFTAIACGRLWIHVWQRELKETGA